VVPSSFLVFSPFLFSPCAAFLSGINTYFYSFFLSHDPCYEIEERREKQQTFCTEQTKILQYEKS
jgi:hypothetical protein